MSGNPEKTLDPQDQTADTGFSETLPAEEPSKIETETTSSVSDVSTKPTRTRKPTEKEFEFTYSQKEKSGRAATKTFCDQLSAFFTFLAITQEPRQIKFEFQNLLSHFADTKRQLDLWLAFTKDTSQSQVVLDLQESLEDSLEGARRAAREKIDILQDKEETSSVKSSTSHASRRSYRSSSSTTSAASKETLVNAKAKRAALEQRIKYSDAIQEQEKILNKLKLQWALSETIAEEAVYEEALLDESPLERLPCETENVMNRFLSQPEIRSADTKFFIWETAFDALIDSAPISAQQKLYLLYQHLDGKAKRVVEQLQYVVGANPEKAYREARKRLKQRFGRSAIVATDFENKLTNWPKIANNDAIGIREFSDFLQQVEIASEHLPALKIFEYPSKIQALVDKLPNWFFTKWSTKVQTLQQQHGCDAFPRLSDFVKEVTFHAERMNIPQISRSTSSNNTRNVANPTNTSPAPQADRSCYHTAIENCRSKQDTLFR